MPYWMVLHDGATLSASKACGFKQIVGDDLALNAREKTVAGCTLHASLN